jgi:hypothetical protein
MKYGVAAIATLLQCVEDDRRQAEMRPYSDYWRGRAELGRQIERTLNNAPSEHFENPSRVSVSTMYSTALLPGAQRLFDDVWQAEYPSPTGSFSDAPGNGVA